MILLYTPYFTPKHQKYVLFLRLETLVFIEQNKCSQIVNTNTPKKPETQQLPSEGTNKHLLKKRLLITFTVT